MEREAPFSYSPEMSKQIAAFAAYNRRVMEVVCREFPLAETVYYPFCGSDETVALGCVGKRVIHVDIDLETIRILRKKGREVYHDHASNFVPMAKPNKPATIDIMVLRDPMQLPKSIRAKVRLGGLVVCNNMYQTAFAMNNTPGYTFEAVIAYGDNPTYDMTDPKIDPKIDHPCSHYIFRRNA